jgi:hypothetical protein
MPFSGNTYAVPAVSRNDAVAGEDITSAHYLTLLNDLETAFNTTVSVARGGTGATTAAGARTNLGITSLSDPGADRVLFWDDSAGTTAYLTVGSGLTISGTTLTADDQSLADGDRGDITVSSSGSVWTVDNSAITEAKIASSAVTEAKIGSGAVTFAKLAAAAVVTEGEGISSNDNDATLPTSAAVKDYVDNNAGTVGGSINTVTRAASTSYQNTQGKPILFMIEASVTGGNALLIELSEDNSTWETAYRGNPSSSPTTLGASVVVPDNFYYRWLGGTSPVAREIY